MRPVAGRAVEVEVVDALDPLDIHRQPFEPVGQLGRDRVAFDAADLLEIGELADLHAVEPDLPAEPPGAQGRALPIVLDKADVVARRVDAERREAAEIEILAVGRRRLQDHLELVIMLQPVRVFAVAAVGRPARRLDIGGAPRLRTERAQGGRRVERAGADLDIIGLQESRSPAPPNSAAISESGPESSTRSPQCSSYNRLWLISRSAEWLSAAAGRPACRNRARRAKHRRRMRGREPGLRSRPARAAARSRAGADAPVRRRRDSAQREHVPHGQDHDDDQNELAGPRSSSWCIGG